MTEQARHEDAAVSLKYDFTTIVREEIGFNELFASQIAEALVRGMRKRLGGQEIYIPAPSKAERIAAVKADFTGNNREEVCRKHGISKAAFYRYIAD